MALTEWQAVGRLGSRPGKATTLVLGFAAQHAASSKEVAPSRIHGFPGTAPLFVPQYKSICPALENLHFYSEENLLLLYLLAATLCNTGEIVVSTVLICKIIRRKLD